MTPRRAIWAAAALPLLFIGYLFLYPLIRILWLGISELELADLLAERRIARVAWFTPWQAAASTGLTLLLAAPLTWAVSRYEFPGRRLAQALVIVPFVLPTVVVGTAFAALGWRDSVWAILAAHVFYNVAVVVRTVGGMWARLDRKVEEAAATLGASPWRVFRTVTLPILRPAIIAAASIVFLFTFTSFGTVLILGGFRYSTIEVEIYRQAVTLFDLPMAAALSIGQMVAVTTLLAVYARRQERTASPLVLAPEASTRRRPDGRTAWAVAVSVVATLTALFVPPAVSASPSRGAHRVGRRRLGGGHAPRPVRPSGGPRLPGRSRRRVLAPVRRRAGAGPPARRRARFALLRGRGHGRRRGGGHVRRLRDLPARQPPVPGLRRGVDAAARHL